MARLTEGTGGGTTTDTPDHATTVQADGRETVALPDITYITNAEMLRDGQDLILRHPDGASFTVEGYFGEYPPPSLSAPGGATLTPELVSSFVKPAAQYAQSSTASDETPVGTAGEITGNATIMRADGTTETLRPGMPIYEGDVIETDAQGAVNVVFIDETSFAISNNAKLAIDEYVFDPATGGGESNFSVLRGMFVFVSGLIGREDPDDVKIETPIGSIGIRGTTIAGNVDSGQITVIEGAIVLRSLDGTTETTLASQYQTARFNAADGTIETQGILDPGTINAQFSAMQNVAPAFFSGLSAPPADANGTATGEQSTQDSAAPTDTPTPEAEAEENAPAEPTAPPPEGYNETSFDGGSATKFADSAGAEAPASAGLSAMPAMQALAASLPAATIGTNTGSLQSALSALSPKAAAPLLGIKETVLPRPIITDDGGTTISPPLLVLNNLDLSGAIAGINGLRLVGSGSEHFGSTLAAVGDMNNDGLADFMIGNDPSSTGTARIYDRSGTLILSRPVQDPGGSDISGLGDIDGDGSLDFIVGSGEAAGGNGYVDIAYAKGVNSLYFTNMGTGYFTGSTVSGAGDINGDGYDDIIVGAPDANGGDGKVMLVFGGASLPTSLEYDDTDTNTIPDFMDAGYGHVIAGGTGQRLGTDVSTAGDFDNDGFADIMYSQANDGKMYINYGTDSALSGLMGSTVILGLTPGVDDIPMTSMGDVNGDGISDIGFADIDADAGRGAFYVLYGNNTRPTGIDVDALSPSQGVSLHLPAGTNHFVSGGSAGDFDGDGQSDVAVAIRNGATIDIYVIYGPALSAGGSLLLDSSFLSNSANAFHMRYSLLGNGLTNPLTDPFDLEIKSPGDVNGDGRDDLLIGAESANGGAGEAILVWGRDGHGATTRGSMLEASAANQSLVGTTGNDSLLSNGGFANVSISAGAGNDQIEIEGSGSIGTIDGGAGFDILYMGATRSVLNFAAVGSEGLSGIERIIMQGTGQTLTLGIDDIFRLMQQSVDNILRIDSPSANSLQIDNMGRSGSSLADLGFTAVAGTTENSINYDVHQFGAYSLYIDTTIAESVV